MDKKREVEIIKQMRKARSRFELVHILQNVEQTQRICEEAIRINPYYLEYIEKQTPELCMMALQSELPYYWDCTPLRFVKEQTPELCMAAVKQEPCSIADVKEQTPDLCLEAVSRNGLTLKVINNQTYDICKRAVSENEYALAYVSDPYMKKQLEKEMKPHLFALISEAEKQNIHISKNKSREIVGRDFS